MNSDILRQCLQDISLHNETTMEQLLEKFSTYSNWTDEEIPCFARCVAAEKGWFDIERHRWNNQQIVDDLGANMYNYCRYEFNRAFENVCTYAFKGLKCLKQVSNHRVTRSVRILMHTSSVSTPFQAELNVIVTYSHLLTCVKEKATSMSQLLEYYHFPAGERIPCLFNCFANKAQLYDSNYQWIIKNWLKAFGPIRDETVNISICRISDEKRRSMNVCDWMYEEYNCWERLNYNTNGSVAYRRALK